MKLTQATVNDLLAQLDPGDGYMYLPSDLNPQDLTDLLVGSYGAPRTLVLDGFTDPTVDESRGAAPLVPRSTGTARPSRSVGAGRTRSRRGSPAFRPGRPQRPATPVRCPR
ncbi:hypothetical protein [Streptomyces sp. NPDC001020]